MRTIIASPRVASFAAVIIGLVALNTQYVAAQEFASGATQNETQTGDMKKGDGSLLDVYPILDHGKTAGEYRPLTSKPWQQKVVFESENPEDYIYQVRVNVEGNTARYIFFSKNDDSDHINLYEKIEGEREHLIEAIHYVDGSGYYFNNVNNLVVRSGNQLYYFTDEKFTGRRYSLGSGLQSVPDDFLISNDKWPQTFRSPNGRYEVNLGTNSMEMTLVDLKTHKKRLLIDQPYDGDWSFGTVTWKSDSSAFFFDNSGAVACIWEYDINTNALVKIVPEHEAKQPYYFQVHGRDFVAYVEGNKVKVATP